MEFEAKKIGNRIVVPCVPERKKNGDLVMHAPSPKAVKEAMEVYDGKRNVQQA